MADMTAEFRRIRERRTAGAIGGTAPVAGSWLAQVAPGHGGEFAQLDGYRAVAALGVVFHHIGVQSFYADYRGVVPMILINLGNFGVAVFFLLSGFLLYRPFVAAQLANKPAPSSSRFYARRFVRILPAYWLALLAQELFVSSTAPSVAGLIRRALLIDVYAAGGVFRGLAVAWTLTVEISFYLALPFIARWVAARQSVSSTDRQRLRVHVTSLGAMYVAGVACRALVTSGTVRFGEGASISLFCFLDWFALGMALAVCVAWRQSGRPVRAALADMADRTWACWICAAFAYALAVFVERDRVSILAAEPSLMVALRVFFNGVAALLFIAPAVLGRRPGLGARVLSSRIAVFLGVISYGLYLWHKPVMHWVWDHATLSPPPSAFIAHLAWVVIPTVIIATLSYRILERPAIDWLRQRESSAPSAGDRRE